MSGDWNFESGVQNNDESVSASVQGRCAQIRLLLYVPILGQAAEVDGRYSSQFAVCKRPSVFSAFPLSLSLCVSVWNSNPISPESQLEATLIISSQNPSTVSFQLQLVH